MSLSDRGDSKKMSKQTIWQFLKHKGFSSEAAAAILGNMEAESNCVANRLQGDFTKGFKRSIDYTAQVDAGNISRHEFIHNGPGGGGYGLCQWTYPPRKAGLYDLAQEKGAAVGDESVQLEWFMKELRQEEYRSLREILQGCSSIRTCSDALVKRFLKPADQSEAVLQKRADLAWDFYYQFSEGESAMSVDGQPEDAGLVKITEAEFRLYSRARLAVTALMDLMKIMEGFENE